MIKSLKPLERSAAEKLLADVIQSFLPQPQPVDTDADPRSIQVLEELRDKLHLEKGTLSPTSMTKVFKALADEVSSLVLTPQAKAASKARLGARGDLRLDLYDVTFDSAFVLSELRGVRRSHVEEVIRRPDGIEHVSVEGMLSSPTLVVKASAGKNADDPFVLLIDANRREDQLKVAAAYRVYLSDVNLSDATTPKDILMQFVHTYGEPFNFGPLGPVRFVSNEYFDYTGELRDLQPNVHGLSSTEMEAICMFRRSTLGGVHVAWAYALNAKRYVTDLQRHGVIISPDYFKTLSKGMFAVVLG
jgi:hypothetical protein